MPDVQSQEEFEHLHRDSLKNLELEKGRLAVTKSQCNLQNLDRSLEKTLGDVHEKLAGELKAGPEAVFQQVLKSLNEVEAKRFVIDNIMESLKRGEDVNVVLKRYGGMGLLPPAIPNEPVEKNPLKTTLALLERKSLWERVTTTVMHLGVNAAKTIPKYVEIEPQIQVFPIPSLSFAVKAKGITVYELFESLRAAQQTFAQEQ